ncbi:hypothetical protein NSERUTF1_5271 [Nocardia seriolae]|nr:hypothetical protein NSERUTF1_5271 [Nocardia seriolae]
MWLGGFGFTAGCGRGRRFGALAGGGHRGFARGGYLGMARSGHCGAGLGRRGRLRVGSLLGSVVVGHCSSSLPRVTAAWLRPSSSV